MEHNKCNLCFCTLSYEIKDVILLSDLLNKVDLVRLQNRDRGGLG
jgi:hypothetical protein